jgi:ABC-type multidrug transport system fused ATPase/permease subunit
MAEDATGSLGRFGGVFRYSGRAFELVWTTSRPLASWMGGLSLAAGLIPAAIAFVGKLIVDAVVLGIRGDAAAQGLALRYVAAEFALVLLLGAIGRALGVCESLLRALLGQRVNEMILDKALTLSLSDFEDSEFYDRMTRARREASQRPLSLVKRAFGMCQNAISLVAYGVILVRFDAWAVLVVVLAALPIFVAETRFSSDAFRLFKWRAPETRKQAYLESLLAREDHAKEVTLFGLGPLFLQRYRQIFQVLFREDRDLTLRRGVWGFALGLLSTAAFYGAYVWIVISAVAGRSTLGDMTLYLLVFKQSQAALAANLSAVGGMYEDNLYLSNLYDTSSTKPSRVAGTPEADPTRPTASASRTCPSAIPERRVRPSLASAFTCRRGRSSPWSARTAPARPR